MFRRSRRSAAAAGVAAVLAALTAVSPAAAAAGPAIPSAGPPPAGPPSAAQAPASPPGNSSSGQQNSVLTAMTAAPSGGVTTLALGGTAYTVPDVAVPYLGHGLNPDLFQDKAPASEEQTGRLPVKVSYRGHTPPTLPGITLTHHGSGAAQGYLTAASARQFIAALDRQYRSDQPDAAYGRAGIFAHEASISLATPPTSNDTQPSTTSTDPGTDSISRPPTRTLKVIATNLAGQPDNDGLVFVTNVDNSALFNLNNPAGFFRDGVATLKVPAGHYWAVSIFGYGKTGFESVQRVTVLPQFSVLKNTTLHVAESAATSEVTMATPRPATAEATNFALVRSSLTGAPAIIGWSNFGTRYPIRVSPTTTTPTVGSLRAFASQQLSSAPGTTAVPYQYAVSYADPRGTIPVQHYVVSAATLATVHERYYQAGPSATSLAQVSGTLPQFVVYPQTPTFVNPSPFPVPTPGRLTQYFGGNMPTTTWDSSYQTTSRTVLQGWERESFAPLHPGEQLTDSWNAYPLHPAVNVDADPASWANQFFRMDEPSAIRSGNTLRLDVSPFGDNEPDHWGSGFTRVTGNKVTGSYQIFQDGKEIASGTPPPESFAGGSFLTKVRLSAQPSVISFTLNASRTGPDFPLSTASHTVWTWRSAHESGVTLPHGWICYWDGFTAVSKCDVQPMMTLDYAVAGMSLTGQVPAGPQAVSVTVGHLQLAPAAALTKATMSVSFDGGKTWQAASVTGSHGHYRATFNAPAGAYVMTRTTAWDAAGGSVAETITRAYQIAS